MFGRWKKDDARHDVVSDQPETQEQPSVADRIGDAVVRWVERDDETNEIVLHRQTIFHDAIRWVPVGFGALALGLAGWSMVGLDAQRADDQAWMAEEIATHQDQADEAEEDFVSTYRSAVERHFYIEAEQYDEDVAAITDAVVDELDDVAGVQVIDGTVQHAQLMEVSDRGHRTYLMVLATQQSDIELANADTELGVEHGSYTLGAEILDAFAQRAAHFTQYRDDLIGVQATVRANDTVDAVGIVPLEDTVLRVADYDDEESDELSEESS